MTQIKQQKSWAMDKTRETHREYCRRGYRAATLKTGLSHKPSSSRLTTADVERQVDEYWSDL